jgi:hypothetical protein
MKRSIVNTGLNSSRVFAGFYREMTARAESTDSEALAWVLQLWRDVAWDCHF